MRKARQANRSFLRGTALLGIAVIALVTLFTMQAFRLSKDARTERPAELYHFVLTADYAGADYSLWLGDSLIAPHATAGDTVTHARISDTRQGDDTQLLIVDNATQYIHIIPVTVRQGTVLLTRPAEE